MAKNQKRQRTSKARKGREDSELAALLKSISHPKIDGTLIRKYKHVRARLEKVLSAASPKSNPELISGIAVDLADFWEISVEHQRRIRSLSAIKFPRDQRRFVDLLYQFEIRLVMHADWHVKKLRPRLARLKRDLLLA
jgi:hypothetical protein